MLLELVTRADVLNENYEPGAMADLGLDYPRLEPLNPGLVMASISHFGQTRPYRDFEGSDLIDYAVSGYMYLTGDEDREPLLAGGFPVGIPGRIVGSYRCGGRADPPGFYG